MPPSSTERVISRPKPPDSFGPMPTSAVTAESVKATFCLPATIFSAAWKQAASPAANSRLGLLARAAHLPGDGEVEVDQTVGRAGVSVATLAGRGGSGGVERGHRYSWGRRVTERSFRLVPHWTTRRPIQRHRGVPPPRCLTQPL